MLEAVNAIENKNSEQRPVVSMALVMVPGDQPVNRNHKSNPTTIVPVTQAVISQPCSFMVD